VTCQAAADSYAVCSFDRRLCIAPYREANIERQAALRDAQMKSLEQVQVVGEETPYMVVLDCIACLTYACAAGNMVRICVLSSFIVMLSLCAAEREAM